MEEVGRDRLLEIKGQSWDVWLQLPATTSDSSAASDYCSTSTDTGIIPCINATASTLPCPKAACYGVCPSADSFMVVKCSECGKAVKPVAFNHHCKARHSTGLGAHRVKSPIPNSCTQSGSGNEQAGSVRASGCRQNNNPLVDACASTRANHSSDDFYSIMLSPQGFDHTPTRSDGPNFSMDSNDVCDPSKVGTSAAVTSQPKVPQAKARKSMPTNSKSGDLTSQSAASCSKPTASGSLNRLTPAVDGKKSADYVVQSTGVNKLKFQRPPSSASKSDARLKAEKPSSGGRDVDLYNNNSTSDVDVTGGSPQLSSSSQQPSIERPRRPSQSIGILRHNKSAINDHKRSAVTQFVEKHLVQKEPTIVSKSGNLSDNEDQVVDVDNVNEVIIGETDRPVPMMNMHGLRVYNRHVASHHIRQPSAPMAVTPTHTPRPISPSLSPSLPTRQFPYQQPPATAQRQRNASSPRPLRVNATARVMLHNRRYEVYRHNVGSAMQLHPRHRPDHAQGRWPPLNSIRTVRPSNRVMISRPNHLAIATAAHTQRQASQQVHVTSGRQSVPPPPPVIRRATPVSHSATLQAYDDRSLATAVTPPATNEHSEQLYDGRGVTVAEYGTATTTTERPQQQLRRLLQQPGNTTTPGANGGVTQTHTVQAHQHFQRVLQANARYVSKSPQQPNVQHYSTSSNTNTMNTQSPYTPTSRQAQTPTPPMVSPPGQVIAMSPVLTTYDTSLNQKPTTQHGHGLGQNTQLVQTQAPPTLQPQHVPQPMQQRERVPAAETPPMLTAQVNSASNATTNHNTSLYDYTPYDPAAHAQPQLQPRTLSVPAARKRALVGAGARPSTKRVRTTANSTCVVPAGFVDTSQQAIISNGNTQVTVVHVQQPQHVSQSQQQCVSVGGQSMQVRVAPSNHNVQYAAPSSGQTAPQAPIMYIRQHSNSAGAYHMDPQPQPHTQVQVHRQTSHNTQYTHTQRIQPQSQQYYVDNDGCAKAVHVMNPGGRWTQQSSTAPTGNGYVHRPPAVLVPTTLQKNGVLIRTVQQTQQSQQADYEMHPAASYEYVNVPQPQVRSLPQHHQRPAQIHYLPSKQRQLPVSQHPHQQQSVHGHHGHSQLDHTNNHINVSDGVVGAQLNYHSHSHAISQYAHAQYGGMNDCTNAMDLVHAAIQADSPPVLPGPAQLTSSMNSAAAGALQHNF